MNIIVTPTQEYVTGLELEKGVNASYYSITRRTDLFAIVPCREPPPLASSAFQFLCLWALLFFLFACPVWRSSMKKDEKKGRKKWEWEHHDGAHVKWTSERVRAARVLHAVCCMLFAACLPVCLLNTATHTSRVLCITTGLLLTHTFY
jgi:hypothetical protein